MTNFDPEGFVQRLMEKLQSLDLTQWVEVPMNLALEDVAHIDSCNTQTFHELVVSFVSSVHLKLPDSMSLNDAHAWDLGNRMLDVAYPAEGSPGSTSAYLDYVSGGMCTVEHIVNALSSGLKSHLQNQHIQSVLNEQLSGLCFAQRLELARVISPRYEELGISIPRHHLAHSLESVVMQVFEVERVVLA